MGPFINTHATAQFVIDCSSNSLRNKTFIVYSNEFYLCALLMETH